MKASQILFQNTTCQSTSAHTEQSQATPSQSSFWQRWLHQLFQRLTVDQPIKVTQKRDRAGKDYYQVYDRHSGKTHTFDSKEDVLIWLDQEYFNS